MFITDRLTGRGGATKPADVVSRRLVGLAPLSDAERDLVSSLSGDLAAHPTGAELVAEGRRPPGPRFIVSGWACRCRALADGRRQIVSFLVPGDPLAAPPRAGRVAMAGVTALTSLQTIDAAPLWRAAANPVDWPGLAEAVARLARQEDELVLDQIVRLGRLSAYQRLAHLLLELRDRLAAVGLASETRMPLPLTQETLADALGLSIVHVNRTLQQLRRERLIELRSGVALLLEPDRLADLCDYVGRADPAEWRPAVSAQPNGTHLQASPL